MDPIRLRTCRKWSTIVGCFLLLLPFGQTQYWGNMFTYCSSYLLNRAHVQEGVQAPWVLALKLCTAAVTNCATGFLLKVTGKRLIVFLGFVLTCSSYFLTYLAIQKYNWLLVISFGVLYGIADGFIFSVSMQYAVDWAGERDGFYTTIVRNGQHVGAALTNLFITWYVNPHNQVPDQRVGPSVFFSQQDILDRIPTMFLILGCVTALCQGLGFLMVRDATSPTATSTITSQNTSNNENKNAGYESIELPRSREDQRSESNGGVVEKDVSHSSSETDISEDRNNMTTREMIRTSVFYALFFTFMFSLIPFITVNNYYKSFGETRISDDALLTRAGTAIPILSVFTIALWGVVMDNINVKTSLIIYHASLAPLGLFYYFTPQLHRWVFIVATPLLGGMVCPLQAVYNIAVVKLFGKTNFAANMGIVMVSSVIIVLIISPVLEAVLLNLGWAYLFIFSSSFNVVALVWVSCTQDHQ